MKQWLQHILAVLLIAACFDLLVMRNLFHNYVRLAVSLCILLILLTPVIQFVHRQPFETWAEDTFANWDERLNASTFRIPAAENIRLQQTGDRQIKLVIEQTIIADLQRFMQSKNMPYGDCRIRVDVAERIVKQIAEVHCWQQSVKQRKSALATDEIHMKEMKPIVIRPIEPGMTSAQVERVSQTKQTHESPDALQVRNYLQTKWAVAVGRIELQQEIDDKGGR